MSSELEELLTKHSNQIDKEYINLFIKLINELGIHNYLNQPFICINNIIPKYNCENTYPQSFNICRCQTFHKQYLLKLKLFKLYKSIFKIQPVEN